MQAISILPDELWEVIFSFACTDGGKAGAALSAVSKDMRRLSASMRYYSVSLRSTWHICVFASASIGQRTSVYFQCRYLLISTRTVDQKEQFAPELIRRTAEYTKYISTSRSLHIQDALQPWQNLSIAALEIIRLLAPSLHALTVTSDTNHLQFTELFRIIRFPKLKDLTWNSHPAFDFLIERGGCYPISTLRRLHVCTAIRPHALSQLAPNLHQLRVSNIWSPQSLLAGFLNITSFGHAVIVRRSPSFAPLPPSLRWIHLHTNVPHFARDRSSPEIEGDRREVVLRQLREIAARIPTEGQNYWHAHTGYYRAYRGGLSLTHEEDWERLVLDGDGPWDEPEVLAGKKEENAESKWVICT
jgi:hypothetical protein